MILDADTAQLELKAHPHDGDHGVLAEWGMYYRIATQESIKAHQDKWVEENSLGAAAAAAHQVSQSPRRMQAREKAAAHQAKQGEEMKKRAKKGAGNKVTIGTVVQVRCLCSPPLPSTHPPYPYHASTHMLIHLGGR